MLTPGGAAGARAGFGADADDAADFLFSTGPTRHSLRSLDGSTIAALRAEVRDALAEFTTPLGVRIPGAVWLVTATRPSN
ncbi:hypothetical protein [Streptomyces wuyuanensis]|uniref:hypothetical protein n=1 Tax=Streptomyces wuyuanensis TaxID=1196353 RepID=UPI00382039A2